MHLTTKSIFSIILFVIMLIAGFWMSKQGKPYNAIIFNVHKLVALAVVVFLFFIFRDLLKQGEASSIAIVLLVILGLSIVALFVTGALMSGEKPLDKMLQLAHRISTATMIISIALSIYVLKIST